MKAFWSYFTVSAHVALREQMAFRANFFLGIGMILLRVFMLLALWNALYIGKTQVSGIDLPTMRFYTIVSVIVEILISSDIEKNVSGRVKDGSIALMINRPISYPLAVFLDQLAHTAQNLAFRVVPYTLILLISGIPFHAQVHPSLAFLLSVVLSYFLMLFYLMFFGFISFWTMEIVGFLQARDALMLVFSGSMIPLWFFPDWLFSIARFLPFQAFYNTPLSILIGKIEGPDILPAILIQALWLGVFLFLSAFFWKKAQRRVVVNGG